MKNLLNCHSIGLHSFPISLENGLYKRLFYAEENHSLWKLDPFELAIHPHHTDIKIRVLDGVLTNLIYEVNRRGKEFMSFKWDSVIHNGTGGFERIGNETLRLVSIDRYRPGEGTTMESSELHTVHVKRGERAVWIIEESAASSEYSSINYSNRDLTDWTSEGLYVEVEDDVKDIYLSPYLMALK